MKQEQFIISFAAALVVCLLIAGYAAFGAVSNAAQAPPVPAEYRAAVLLHNETSNANEEAIVAIDGWQTLTLEPGQQIWLAEESYTVLRQGTATCIESDSTGLTSVVNKQMLAQDEPLALDTLYRATVPAIGFEAAAVCTILLSGQYSIT